MRRYKFWWIKKNHEKKYLGRAIFLGSVAYGETKHFLFLAWCFLPLIIYMQIFYKKVDFERDQIAYTSQNKVSANKSIGIEVIMLS